jgi:hypothetical protein
MFRGWMELALVIHIHNAEVLAAIRSRLSHAFASELSFGIFKVLKGHEPARMIFTASST